jgi:hypothetical protein
MLEDRTLPAVTPLFAQFQSLAGLLTVHDANGSDLVSASVLSDNFVQVNVGGQSFSSNPVSANYDSALAGASGLTLRGIQLGGDPGQDHLVLGNLNVAGGLAVQCDGVVDIQGQVSAAGPIQLSGYSVLVAGQVRADGLTGGSITVTANSVLQSGLLEANGNQGAGGSIRIDFSHSYVATVSAVTSASSTGTGAGGLIVIDGQSTGTLFTSGKYQTSSVYGGPGGEIDLFGQQVHLVGANVDASGWNGGGWVRVGGDSPSDIAAHGGSSAGVSFAATTTVDPTTTLSADALGTGNGGRIVVWSQQSTTFAGTLQAQGAGLTGQGGLLEVSSAGLLTYGGQANATATSSGQQGRLLLDPKNLTISDTAGPPQFNLVNPNADSLDTFGSSVVVLSNGNVVVTDPGDGSVAVNAGAVFLFNRQTGALLGELTGSTSNDQVGSGGVTALTNGNYVVNSPGWQTAGAAVGAATWVSGSGGPVATVSVANSFIGSTSNDQVGSGGVTALTNGNYVVISPNWQSGGAAVGAVTWGNGFSGTAGAVSASNSLIGSTNFDAVGSGGITALKNGNYVVDSPSWQNPNGSSGAATWGNGVGGTVGPVSAANSLVGGLNGGGFASSVTGLANGNYVVASDGFNAGTTFSTAAFGAVTWGNGSTGTVGDVTPSNSLIGGTAFDEVGSSGVTALANGDFVVSSPLWHHGGNMVGAATWGAGNGSTMGTTVSASNSLVGSTAGDNVGSGGVTALSNGNYVVSSPNWQSGTNVVGAVTWSNGTTGQTNHGVFEAVSATNSLIGSTNGDQVGFGNGNPGSGVTALANGNYVVSSPNWQSGTNVVGAVTWGNGNGGTVGAVTSGNSLVGSTTGDNVGSQSVTALTNGNYVVSSPNWQNSGTVVGAVTFGNGGVGTVGPVTSANSLVGSTAGDNVGNGGVTALSNGNYVVNSPNWHSGGAQVGAATWSNGTTGQTIDGTETVDTVNSLVGAGSGAVLQLVVGLPGGSAFLASFSGNGGSVIEAQVAASPETFATAPTQFLNVSPSFLTATLDTGTAVVLQASNDITVNSNIVVNNPSGNGGNLTLQAGRQILLNASITTGNGNLTLIANDTAADGVVDNQRDPGFAAITMTAGTSINAGTGTVTVLLSDGAGNTYNQSDDISLTTVIAGSIIATRTASSAGVGVDLGAVTDSGSLTIQSAGDITQTGGAWNVTGPTSLTATAPIILSNSGNSFASTVTISDPGASVTVDATGNLALAATSSPATLTVAASGIFGESGPLGVSGAASFTGGAITLTNAANSFQGPVSLNSTGAIALTNGSALALGNLTLAASAAVSAPSIAFTGNLNVGAQTLTLTGPAHLNGNTTLAGGTISDSSGLVVGSGGTLSGSGTLQAGAGASGVFTQVGATLAPGLTPGGLTVDGDLILAPVSILSEQIQSTAAFSQLTVNGAINLGGASLEVAFQNGYARAPGDHFQILNNGPGSAITNMFAQGDTVTLDETTLAINYGGAGNNIVLTVAAPVVTVPGTQQFVANKNVVITGISASDAAFAEGNGTVQATLSVQSGALTLGNAFVLSFLTFSQGNGSTPSSTMVFTGPLTYVNLALSNLIYRANQDTAQPDTLTVSVNDQTSFGTSGPLSDTKTVALTPQTGVFVVADPVLTGKQDLVIQGAGNDTISVSPGKVSGAFVVTVDHGSPQTFTGITGRILVFDLAGSNNIALSSSVKLPALIVVGNGNNTVVGGAGNDTLVAGSGSNKLDGGGGTNTLIESGNTDFTLVGGTSKVSGSLTKGASTDQLVFNHIQQVKLTIIGSGPHTIDGTKFSGPETLTGGAGVDTLLAGSGSDVLVAGSGGDSLVAGSGNDTLLGGSGSDSLVAGKGNDVLVGGSGNDTLSAGAGTGKDVLIAGGGADTLNATGSTNQDLLIGGTTSYNTNLAALNAIMAEWASTTSYATKIKHLMGNLSGGKNGHTFLTATGSSPTVQDAGKASTMNAGSGLDWFWKSPSDVINGNNGGTVTPVP